MAVTPILQKKINRLRAIKKTPEIGSYLAMESIIKEQISKNLAEFLSTPLGQKLLIEAIVDTGIAMKVGEPGSPGTIPKVGIDFNQPKDGKTPQVGIDFLTKADIEKIVRAVANLFSQPKDGKTPIKGVTYFTEQDKKEMLIALRERFPEKLEKPELSGEDIIKKINESRGIIKRDRSEEPDIALIDKKLPKRKGFAGEWGPRIMDFTAETFTVSSGTTIITIKSHPTAGGRALLLFYNGKYLHQDEHYTIDGRVITFLITLDNDSTIDAHYTHR